jgi:hypothetical protein
MKTHALKTTPLVYSLKRRFKVTHEFHPLYRREFVLLDYRSTAGNKFLDYEDDEGNIGSIELHYTDAKEPDPFMEISNRRSLFRYEDLLRLVELLNSLSTK